MPKTTRKQIQIDLKKILEQTVRAACLDIGECIKRASPQSALNGLEITALAFSIVLDTYASPNPLNQQGMCDDQQMFRKYFADIIIRGAK